MSDKSPSIPALIADLETAISQYPSRSIASKGELRQLLEIVKAQQEQLDALAGELGCAG